jgi:S1-C subfamily serine protease
MKLYGLLALFFACHTVCSQTLPQPITQIEACRRFKPSIVQVDTDTMHGTGFIVGAGGWIITALHVVADQKSLVKYENIRVSVLGHSRPVRAEIVSRLDNLARQRDFAILKVDETNLPALDLESEIDIEDGSPIAIIGLPLSASFGVPVTSVPRFCLTGTVAAQSTFPLGGLNFLHTIYFQGVSIKGISGAPIISLITGKVVGIVSTRLTGISQGLDETRTTLVVGIPGGPNATFQIMGVDFGKTITTLIDTLDQQLANGLGSGNGASDAAFALKEVQHSYEKAK